jgi:hypothetical protein
MRPLSDSDLLGLWEGGLRRHPLDRALLALTAAFPETPHEELANWPLGRRNRALFELRSSCFGPSVRGWLACASCGDKLEFELDGRMIVAATPIENERAIDESIVVKQRAFRLPNSRDLADAAAASDPRLGAIRIVGNCRLAPADLSHPDSEHWSDEDLGAIGERMALADPLAETRLSLHCPKCQCDWDETLDIALFLWAEIEARARRLLLEVHTLAAAYGWTENEILSLSQNRRARYLEMVQS